MNTLIHIAIAVGVIAATCLIVWAVETHKSSNDKIDNNDEQQGW